MGRRVRHDRRANSPRCPSPDAAAFYTSGRTSNEAAFLYQLLARSFGTNNLPDCSNMCHEASGAALTETIGIGKGSVHITDFAEADLIVVVGQNPGTNHPRMLSTLEEAKRKGASIVAINPLPEAGLIRFKNPQRASGMIGSGTALADDYLPDPDQRRPRVLQSGQPPARHRRPARRRPARARAPASTARSSTSSRADSRHSPQPPATFDWDVFTAATGFDRSVAEAFAERVRRSERIIVCWAMGLTQHANSVATIREVVNLLLLGGNIGRPGAGVCPVRGHSNVQGDRTMGIVERPSDRVPRRPRRGVLVRAASCPRPRHRRHDPGDARRHGHVLHGHGRQLRIGHARHGCGARGPGRCALTVQVSTKLNASHLVVGDQALILPTKGRTERHEVDGVDRS